VGRQLVLRNDAGGGSFLTGFDGDLGEDARSFAARQQDSYGILQLSFGDTYAGTAAGAFALTENSLYTTEAWRIFLESLDADGILSVTRYYFSDLPAEFYRLFGLATAVLRQRGAAADSSASMGRCRSARPSWLRRSRSSTASR